MIRFILTISWAILLVTESVAQSPGVGNQRSILKVRSKDGTSLAVECTGAGPTLLIVHGGTGDRRRWMPLFPLWGQHFTKKVLNAPLLAAGMAEPS